MTLEQWLETVGKEKVQAFQDSFAQIFDISLSLLSLDGETVTVSSNSSLLCDYTMKNNKKRCGQEKAALINRTIQTQTLQLYTCYMHLKTFCCPIFYKGELIGLFYGGAVRCNKFQFTFSDVPVISDQKFTSITNLLISILNLLSIDKAEQTKPKAKGSYAILRKKLTRREYDVAELICKGLTNKEISVELHISEKTVKSHVSNILKKLQMKDRMQILLFVNKI